MPAADTTLQRKRQQQTPRFSANASSRHNASAQTPAADFTRHRTYTCMQQTSRVIAHTSSSRVDICVAKLAATRVGSSRVSALRQLVTVVAFFVALIYV